MAFTVPAVPTGIKMGVSMSPWAVDIIPALALDSLSSVINLNFNIYKITGVFAPAVYASKIKIFVNAINIFMILRI
jgi:hypothetical protein